MTSRLLSLLAIAVAASLRALAQQTEEIIVTGSRVSRSGFDSSQPLTTIDAQQIQNLGIVNVGHAYYLTWSGSYDFPRAGQDNAFQVFWVINNLLDEDPQIAPGGNAYPTNPVFFDTIGRRFRAGVRFSF